MQNERGTGGAKEDYEIRPTARAQHRHQDGHRACRMHPGQGVDNVYETDLLKPIIDVAVELTGRAGRVGDQLPLTTCGSGSSPTTRVPRRCSSPTGAARQRGPRLHPAPVAAPHRALGASARGHRPTMEAFVSTAIDVMAPVVPGPRYRPRTHSHRRRRRGGCVRQDAVGRFGPIRRGRRRDEGRWSSCIKRRRRITLHDTYGFPIDLTLEMAGEAD